MADDEYGTELPGGGTLEAPSASPSPQDPAAPDNVQGEPVAPPEDEADVAAGEEAEAAATDVDATEGAEELAQELGVDLDDVEGTGADGRVTKADVQKYADEQEAGA